jgi:hypothetical protein
MMRKVTLDARRLSDAENLDVEGFVREFDPTPAQAKPPHSMLLRVIPWLVGAGAMTQARADSVGGTIAERCPEAGLAAV